MNSQANSALTIGLHGLPGTGKDTLADYLVDKHGFTKVAFADRLKRELCRVFNEPMTTFTNRVTKIVPSYHLRYSRCNYYPFIRFLLKRAHDAGDQKFDADAPRTPRYMMQAYGDFCREHNPNYFIETVEQVIRETEGHVVVTDVRFQNERDAVKFFPRSYIIEVIRTSNPYCESRDKHASNAMLPPQMVDWVIGNDGAPEGMFEQFDGAVKIFDKGIDRP